MADVLGFWWLVVAVVISAVIFGRVWSVGGWFDRELRTREPLDDDTLFRRFFAGGSIPPSLPGRVRKILAETLSYPADRLRPEDDFHWLLAELDVSDILEDLEKEFAIEISDLEAARVSLTLDAIIR